MTEETYFVQHGRTVISGTKHGGDRRIFSPGDEIKLTVQEAAPLLSRGVIGDKPPRPRLVTPGSNPAGIGLQTGPQLDLNAQGPRW